MSYALYLTDSESDISGYLVAKLGRRSDCPSLVRAVTSTEAGPSSGVQVTRSAGGSALAWLTEPLDGTDLTAAAWEVHVWAKESAAAANAAIRVQVLRYTTAEGSTVLDDNPGTECGTTIADTARSVTATGTTLNDGDRLVIKLLIDDAGTLAAGQTVTVAYNGETPRAEGDSYLLCPDALSVTAATPTDTRTRVRNVLKDTSSSNPELSDAQVNQAIDQAVQTYSLDRPRVVADYLSGDGSSYTFRLPRRWIHGFSRVVEVEYPLDSQQPTLLEPTDYNVEELTLGTQPLRRLRFLSVIPESGTDNVLVRSTTRHVHSDELDTIPADDLDPVCWLAAAYAALTLAARQAAARDSTIAADAVSYRDGEQRWRSVADKLTQQYAERIRGSKESSPVTGLVRDWDTTTPYGADRLIHRRRWR